jgi:cell wall-associated NlpC family hydrolase
MWTNDYIDLPYKIDGRDRGGVDCWGLVHLVYRERLGVTLPDIEGYHAAHGNDWAKIAAVMEEGAARWQQVARPSLYDAVLLRRGPLACHVGVYAGNGNMLHICEGINSTVEPVNGLRWKKRVVGFYRR